MRCPVDNEPLVMADRSGVEIDYCPKCRGVWLDRGELDKVIERAASATPPPAPVALQQPRPAADGYGRGDDGRRDDGRTQPRRRDDDDDDRYDNQRKRRGGFLGELFDF